MEAGSSENPFAKPWMAQSSMPAQNYVNFLAESSAYLPLSSYEDMLERISSSVGGIHDCGLSELQRDLLYGNGKASGSKSLGFSMDMAPWKMLSEPLEEIIGKLLETDPGAAEKLLKDKGLSLVPLAWTEKLF